MGRRAGEGPVDVARVTGTTTTDDVAACAGLFVTGAGTVDARGAGPTTALAATDVDGLVADVVGTDLVAVIAGLGVVGLGVFGLEFVGSGAAGMNAGRAVCVGIEGSTGRSATSPEWVRVMLMATTAQPATASVADTEDTIRPTYMWPVCQVLLM